MTMRLLECRAMVWWVVVLFIITKARCAKPQERRNLESREGRPDSEELPRRDLFESRIVGGTTASQGEFPFFVLWSGCGASLIAPNLVLTAAHCRVLPEAADGVLVGALIDSSSQGGAQFRTIKKRHVHPNFSNVTMTYDYMVMELDKPVTGITPVKLNSNPSYPVDNQLLTVIGFGATTTGGDPVYVLRKVNVNAVNSLSCNTDYEWQLTPSLMLCAGVSGGGKDSCQGDSGGPILDANNVQVGITSFGNGCGVKGFPGVYARISGGISWINQQICLYSSNPPASCKNRPTGSPPVAAPTSSLVAVQISIMYDKFPGETSWILATSAGKAVYYAPGSSGSAYTLSTTPVNLAPGSYILQLQDGYGDGFCCSNGNGYYVINAVVNGNKIQLSKGSGKFQFQLVIRFNVPSTTVRAPGPPTRKPTLKPTVKPTLRPTARPVAPPPTATTCKDSTIVIPINGNQKTCAWLSVRPSLWPSQCVNGKAAFTYCKRTCKRC